MNKLNLLLLLLLLFIIVSSNCYSDPITQCKILEKTNENNCSEDAIYSFYEKKHILENGSLPTISSSFEKMKGEVRGHSFGIKILNNSSIKNVLITNAHLLQGKNKSAIFDKIKFRRRKESQKISIRQQDVYYCSNQDIAIVNLDNTKLPEFYKSFGRYDYEEQTLYTKGMNNSPKSGNWEKAFEVSINENMKPLFNNILSGEMLNFIQMGNMFDRSCNFYPSSPEFYKGNAIFVPINNRINQIIKDVTPFRQIIFKNLNNLSSIREMIMNGNCSEQPDAKFKDNDFYVTSFASKNIIVPAGIVPGMSGLPLLINDDLLQSKYIIAGMATSYNRNMQSSYFTGAKNIKDCLNDLINNKLQNENVEFKFSDQFETLYRESEDFTEIPLIFSNLSGDGLVANGGTYQKTKNKILKSGIMYKEKHVVGFNCKFNNEQFNVFANWESRYLFNEKNSNCEPIYINSKKMNLIKLFKLKNKAKILKGVTPKNNNASGLKIKAKISIVKEKIKFVLDVSYKFLKFNEKISFKETIFIDSKLQNFEPLIKIKLTEDKLKHRRFMKTFKREKYLEYVKHAHDELILDVKELFFIDLERVNYNSKLSIVDALKKNNRVKVYGSIKYKDSKIGSIPIEIKWK